MNALQEKFIVKNKLISNYRNSVFNYSEVKRAFKLVLNKNNWMQQRALVNASFLFQYEILESF